MNFSRDVKRFLRPMALFALIILWSKISYGVDAGSAFERALGDDRNFWVLNDTAKVISALYVSPHNTANWGKDVLGVGTLPNGRGAKIYFPSSVRSSCLMDFKLLFADGSAQTYLDGRNVCLLGAVEFDWNTSVGLLYPPR